MSKKHRYLLDFFVLLVFFLAFSFSVTKPIKAAPSYESYGKEFAVTATTTKTVSFDMNGADTKKAQHTISYYIYLFGGTIVAFSMGLAAMRMILVKNSQTKREETMTAFGKIILGCSILGSCILLSGFLIGVANHLGSAITDGNSSLINVPTTTITDDDGNFVVKAFGNIFLSVEKCIFNLFDKYFGFLPLDKLIFNSSANAFGVTGTITVPPFTNAEWSNLNYMYLLVSSICAPLVLLMVAKTGISLIMSANRPAQRSQLQEDVCRWLFSLALIALGPLLLKGLFLLSSDMTNAVVSIFNASLGKDNYVTDISMVDSIKTGSFLTSAIVKCLFAWKFFQINMLFMVRKIILTAMYAFTPLAALFWGIDNRTQAIQIWFGEMITNATMQFFYAFTFSIMIISLSGSSWKNWFYALVWVFALVKLAEVFRNSLQGLFTKLAGVDEMSIAGRSFGPVSKLAIGAAGAMARTFKVGNPSKLSNGLNIGGLRNSALGSAVFGAGGKKPQGSSQGAKDAAGKTAAAASATENFRQSSSTDQGEMSSNPQAAQNRGNQNHNKKPNEYEESLLNYMDSENGTGAGGYASDNVKNSETDPIINPENFNGLDSLKPITDSEGNVNMNNLKAAGSRHMLYSSMLNDNLKKFAAEKPMGAKVLGGVSRAMNHKNTGMANRVIAGKAINATIEQMQSLAGGENKLSKQDALTQLFGGETKSINKNVDGHKFEITHNRNAQKFKSALEHGDIGRASQVITNANPINGLSLKQQSAVIARTSPYTNIDGFRW
ncbi:hypothetical protein ACFHWD_12655 [Clostridium sp. MT-14]|uniref:Uncharacterized protein n=1 Tax=Clostridium aromativorans TaxID=2836848 RepID=A0ABS8N880_9CLOT|nr:hypothetical protein [Clostridium aromativorans]MCC9296017.1 hypothetical protein [Clostridium aromativorans]CAB1249040.1 conserved membrane hypothetical protein [Clostridiaceae bacterium BL-3]